MLAAPGSPAFEGPSLLDSSPVPLDAWRVAPLESWEFDHTTRAVFGCSSVFDRRKR